MTRHPLPAQLLPLLLAAFLPCRLPAATPPRSPQYAALQQRLARGWNTWNTQSVLSQVLLPEGLAINLGLRSSALGSEQWLPDALIGRLNPHAEQIFPGPHTYNGSYTELTLTWQGNRLRVQSATTQGDLVLLVTPLKTTAVPPVLAIKVGMLWNRPGTIRRNGNDGFTAKMPGHSVRIFTTADGHNDYDVDSLTPYLAFPLSHAIGLSTGHARPLGRIEQIIAAHRAAYETGLQRWGSLAGDVDALQTVIAWDTIYDPSHDRVITPVSRLWNIHWGGYVLFDWDTFFAAAMAGLNDRDLAYANALEILNEETPAGFVPNFGRALGWKSDDRSEPPVGSIVVQSLYRKYHDRWFLRDAFPALLRWNRWWNARRNCRGYLCWGSDPSSTAEAKMDSSVHTLQGARYESGLDNSPMYDHVTFNPKTSHMELADVGLMSLYIADCHALAQIATEIGRPVEAKELQERAQRYSQALQKLWDPKVGMFLNLNLTTGKFSHRMSPTNFYPLLARVATPAEARRMVREHLQNPKEFWGKWVIPSIARDDPAFQDQNYWRGRIWGPMNYLVYLGLRNYSFPRSFPKVQAEFAQKSQALLMQEWRAHGHVHENYNAITGEGDDVLSSDRFYHWGALLGLIEILQQGRYQ